MRFFVSFIISILLILSCSTIYLAVDPVEEFEIEHYMGKWYEIYRLPNKFEEGLSEITINYQLGENKEITVVHEGRLIDDRSRMKQARGRAWIPSSNEPYKLKISYQWPFVENYWILKIDDDYNYALVGDPSGKQLWILSRESRLDSKIVEELKLYASTLGFNVENLISSQFD